MLFLQNHVILCSKMESRYCLLKDKRSYAIGIRHAARGLLACVVCAQDRSKSEPIEIHRGIRETREIIRLKGKDTEAENALANAPNTYPEIPPQIIFFPSALISFPATWDARDTKILPMITTIPIITVASRPTFARDVTRDSSHVAVYTRENIAPDDEPLPIAPLLRAIFVPCYLIYLHITISTGNRYS